MARVIQPDPNPNHPMWKLHYESVDKMQELCQKQSALDIEQQEHNKMIMDNAKARMESSSESNEEKTAQGGPSETDAQDTT